MSNARFSVSQFYCDCDFNWRMLQSAIIFREGKFGGWSRMMLFYIVVFSHLECVLSVLKLYSGFRYGKMQGQLKITRITKQWSKLDPWFVAIRIVSYWTMRYDHNFWGLVMFCQEQLDEFDPSLAAWGHIPNDTVAVWCIWCCYVDRCWHLWTSVGSFCMTLWY